ncbi:Serine/threonine-protein kinase PK-1 [Enhygromyxa salina]|uniref:Serine/threonine-protein kinase PK-1 n=1 Tax=Enhygromyxa salina TaxID=215803 RepID=A0A2S9XIY8_9BACT|nr:serine/threonine-protein kinase [Enhygromyxa salina]PRP92844.1 Serine/threonine-protein kinase PK-1 [Enhygromyxa salina]
MPSPSDDATLDATQLAPGQAKRVPVELGRGEQLGRYLIVDELGAGGMGKVYAAYDPELDRKLAIKLLHQAPGTEVSDASLASSSRLQREAQAMAKLSHRNVVAVYDVGIHRGSVFVAMEFVDGGTLDGWLREGPHPWREVLDRFIAAGRGLAAAHAAGLIHRDFKPANVLLGADGRVQVADFGLARRAGDTPARPRAISALSEDTLGDSLSAPLTQTGALVGTPAYMAPEQFFGADVDARSDQFSFCVALWEALYGQRPFAGDTAAAILFALEQGKLREPPASATVPSRLRRVVERGLAKDPAARWPDMPDLLEALVTDPAARRRRVAGVVLGVAGLAAIAIVPQLRAEPEPKPEPEPPPAQCTGAEQALGQAWSSAQQAAVHARYAKLDGAWVAEHEARLSAQLDGWARAWTGAWTETCAATRIRGEQSEDMLDQRMLCLERRRARFETFVDELANADDDQLRRASAKVDDIGDIDDCSDPEIMHARVPPPADPARRAEFERLLGELDAVLAQRTIGRYAEAKARLEPAYEAALATEHPTLIAEARYVRGDLLSQLREDGAEGEIELAYEGALAAGLFLLAGKSAEDLASLIGVHDSRHPEAERWLRVAEALADYVDNDSFRILLHEARGRLERGRGNYELAIVSYERAVAMALELYGPDAQRTGDAYFNLSTAQFDEGHIRQAMAGVERAQTIWAGTLGPDDLRSLVALNARAVLAWQMGDAATADELFAELLERRTRLFGPEHITVAAAMFNYGALLSEIGDPGGVEMLERALTVYEREYGDDNMATAQCKANLSIAVARSGDGARGLKLLDEARAVMRTHRQDTQVDLVKIITLGVEIHRRMGNWKVAFAEGERARARLEAAGEGESAMMANLLVELGQIELGRGHPLEALAQVEAADAIVLEEPASSRVIAERRLVVAKALRALGRDDEARQEVGLARAAYLENSEAHPGDWLWDELDE